MTANELLGIIIWSIIGLVVVSSIIMTFIALRKYTSRIISAIVTNILLCVSVGMLVIMIVLIIFSPMSNHEKAITALKENGETLQEIVERGAPLDTYEEEILKEYDAAWHIYQDNTEKNDDFWYQNIGEFPKYYRSNAGTLMKGEN